MKELRLADLKLIPVEYDEGLFLHMTRYAGAVYVELLDAVAMFAWWEKPMADNEFLQLMGGEDNLVARTLPATGHFGGLTYRFASMAAMSKLYALEKDILGRLMRLHEAFGAKEMQMRRAAVGSWLWLKPADFLIAYPFIDGDGNFLAAEPARRMLEGAGYYLSEFGKWENSAMSRRTIKIIMKGYGYKPAYPEEYYA